MGPILNLKGDSRIWDELLERAEVNDYVLFDQGVFDSGHPLLFACKKKYVGPNELRCADSGLVVLRPMFPGHVLQPIIEVVNRPSFDYAPIHLTAGLENIKLTLAGENFKCGGGYLYSNLIGGVDEKRK